MKFYLIFFLSLITLSNQIALSSEEPDICQIFNPDDSTAGENPHEEIHRIALKQSQAIDLYLEDLAQAVKSNKIKLKTKDKFEEFIVDIIDVIKKIKKENSLEDDKNTLKLLKFNSIILDNIEIAISMKLQAFDKAIELEILKEISGDNKLDLIQACQLLGNNQKKLENLKICLAQFNLTKTNLLAQNIEKLLKRFYLIKIGKRLAPYACLGLCLVLKKIILDKINSNFGNDSSSAPTSNSPDDSKKPPAKSTPTDTDSGTSSGNAPTTSTSASTGTNNPTSSFFNRLNIFKNDKLEIANIIKISNNPIIDIGFSAIFWPIIQQDATDFKDWSFKQAKKISAYIKGEKPPSETIKRSKLKFEDIIGYDFAKEEFKKVANYFQEKKLLDFVDSYVDHNYLLVGPCDIGANLSDALATEITKVISQENKNAFCGVYEMHASKLINKKFADIIKDAENHDYPCIIILNELHWLAKHANKKAEIWSNLLDGLNCLKNPLKQVFVIATTSTLEESISELGSATKVIHLEKPNFKERKDFFQKKLLERCANIENFDLENLAKLTENCSFNQLSNIMRIACNKAHAQTESLKQSHIEQSIVPSI